MHHGIPQVTMDYPEYKKINDEFEVAVLISHPQTVLIENAINKLLHDEAYYNLLKQHCHEASKVYNWQNEEKKLITFYKQIFG